jgi:hypothetical protein
MKTALIALFAVVVTASASTASAARPTYTCQGDDITVTASPADEGLLYEVTVALPSAAPARFTADPFLGSGVDATFGFERGQGALLIDAAGTGELTLPGESYVALRCERN